MKVLIIIAIIFAVGSASPLPFKESKTIVGQGRFYPSPRAYGSFFPGEFVSNSGFEIEAAPKLPLGKQTILYRNKLEIYQA